jgi:hypothetical protein
VLRSYPQHLTGRLNPPHPFHCLVFNVPAFWYAPMGVRRKSVFQTGAHFTCVIPAKAGIQCSTSGDGFIQILPAGIAVFDQFQLPCTFPILQRFFPPNCRFHGFVKFVPYQRMDPVALGESIYHVVLVLPYPFCQIRSHADIEGTISLAGQNIDCWLFVHDWSPGFQLSLE